MVGRICETNNKRTSAAIYPAQSSASLVVKFVYLVNKLTVDID